MGTEWLIFVKLGVANSDVYKNSLKCLTPAVRLPC